MEKTNNLVWIDMEMSGLDPETNVILEIATIITDSELNIVAKNPSIVLSQPANLFDTMDEWNQSHHTASGLWEQTQKSEITLEQAEAMTYDFIKAYVEPNKSPLCGNSIFQDKRFLVKFMPKVDDLLHYRLIDVSTIKELCSRWLSKDDEVFSFKKKNVHRALEDIEESIEELKIYKKHIFLKNLNV